MIQDHKGNEFTSLDDMLKKYNISRKAYSNRIIAGWSLEDVLTKESKNNQTYKNPSQEQIEKLKRIIRGEGGYND